MTTSNAADSLRLRFSKLRTPGNAEYFDKLADYFSPEEKNPCVEMYFTYALSTNERGRRVADILENYAKLKDSNYLDIGCAYAGFLVAFAERGAKVHGLEISPNNAELAKANLKNAGVDVQVMYRDATCLGDIIEMCNRMDVITCNDVVEHVENPLSLVTNISLLLAPGGIAYLEFPNKYFPRFVRSDGHYGLFGITLLDNLDAKEYFRLHKPNVPYDVIYLELDQFNAMIRHAGMTLEILKETYEGFTVDSILADVQQLEKDAKELLQTVPKPMLEKVSAKFSDYLRSVRSAPLSSESQRQEFLLRFGPSFWRLIGRNDANNGAPKTPSGSSIRRGAFFRTLRSALRRLKNR
jgi:2-polyprenyl-3-methyl-5-hydroxy-6-metoxy-1,4-benzoquinol methylase